MLLKLENWDAKIRVQQPMSLRAAVHSAQRGFAMLLGNHKHVACEIGHQQL